MQGTRTGRALRTFGAERRGNVAVIFAIATPVLALLWAGAVDFNRLTSARSDLQDSLDAATLAVARSEKVTDPEFQELGDDALAANVRLKPGRSLGDSRFYGADNGRTVKAEATMVVERSVIGGFGDRTVSLSAASEVVRASNDVEVSLVLDTTGSMAGQKIIDLRAAAQELVDIVVKDQQTPFYTKVAIVPYSMAVNVGSYATEARGAITPGAAITGATKANPVRITSNNHGFANGARVWIRNVQGMTQLNNKEFVVSNATSNTFTLRYVDSNGNLQNVDGTASNYGSYTRNGLIFCTTPGCQYYGFNNNSNPSVRRVFQVSTCVTERTGVNAYTDVAPSVAPFGRNYPGPNNPCIANTVQPLTSNKAALKTSIDNLAAAGSTGGHIGVGWGWYTLSPQFRALWPAESDPGDYRAKKLIKATVIMTDGEYNSSYCNGVISRDSTTGSGSPADHVNCDAPNGHAFDQAQALCTAMKAEGVLVYTIGFAVVNDQRARNLVNQCATSEAHVHLPSTGADLKQAFRLIAQDLSRLRLSH